MLCVLAAALACAHSDPPRLPAPATLPRPHLVHRPSIAPSLGMLAGLQGAAAFIAFSGIRAQEVGLDNPSLVLMLYGLTVIGMRIAFARLPDRVRPLRLAAAAVALITVGLLWAALVARSPAALLAEAIAIGAGIAFLTPAFFAAVFAGVPASQRGAASGTASMAIDLGLGGGPAALGLVAGARGIPAAYATGALVAALGVIWTARLARLRGAAVAPTAAEEGGAPATP